MSSEKVIHSVSAGCSQGRVTWRYPHGGLRVGFSLPPTDYDDDDDDAEFDVCCMVTVRYCDVKLSLDAGDTLRVISVLKTSSSSSSSSESAELCFQTSRGRAVSLYAESLASHGLSCVVGSLVVDYDVRNHDNATSSADMRGEFPVVIVLGVQSCLALCSVCV